jgi:hypothetical protein
MLEGSEERGKLAYDQSSYGHVSSVEHPERP